MNVTQKTRFASTATKAGAGVALVTVGASAMAQQASTVGDQVIAKVQSSMSQGEAIAGAVVLGLFAIWAIKLLFRAK